jgi:putative nucleotidyltransferase with HDIG domain
MYHSRQDLERLEETSLAPYAMKSSQSRGRAYPEDEPAYRTVFQRDRDRILHTTAFRRLEYKTQVFVNSEGDYYRTRLTHTLEVCQIGQTIARALGLNQDLVEVIALAHDIGHPAFGHAGEQTLAELMAEHGGFDHNTQSLRIVEKLERRIQETGIASLDDVRRQSAMLVGSSAEMAEMNRELKAFLYQGLYRHWRVVRMATKARLFLQQLFGAYVTQPEILPPDVQARVPEEGLHRAICDHIAGMTDRYALGEYSKLFDPFERV